MLIIKWWEKKIVGYQITKIDKSIPIIKWLHWPQLRNKLSTIFTCGSQIILLITKSRECVYI